MFVGFLLLFFGGGGGDFFYVSYSLLDKNLLFFFCFKRLPTYHAKAHTQSLFHLKK